MRIVVVGSGGREHALASVLARHHEVVVTPGNPGIPGSVADAPEDLVADLYVIGPEAPLVDGLADRLRAAGRLVFGPGADGARLEGSKAWMKEVVAAAGVPTARHGEFDDVDAALAFLDVLDCETGGGYVVKTDGLAAGKGVLVTDDRAEAEADVRAKLAGDAFGDAGLRVVIEERMTGPELSVLAVCDGADAVCLAPAQDFKRVGDGDTGPNTGGMGCYSPVPAAGDDVLATVLDDFVRPTLAELRRRGIDYRGVLYAGLMLTPDGPRLVEYNVRFGDPEAQVVLPRLTSDLGVLLAEAADGALVSTPAFSEDACVAVAVAAEGYPATPRTGDPIDGVDAARAIDGVDVLFAGVAAEQGPSGEQVLVTAGGRVLYVLGSAPTIAEARARAYAGVAAIGWPGAHHRTDIAATPTT